MHVFHWTRASISSQKPDSTMVQVEGSFSFHHNNPLLTKMKHSEKGGPFGRTGLPFRSASSLQPDLARPNALWIAGADDAKFCGSGWHSFRAIRRKTQGPAGLRLDFRDTAAGMVGLQQGFAAHGIEGKDGQRRD